MDVTDEGDAYAILVDVPGVRGDSIEVAPGPVPGTLVLRGEVLSRHAESPRLLAERRQGGPRFERVVPVAPDADVGQATVTLTEGLLSVVVPKNVGSPAQP